MVGIAVVPDEIAAIRILVKNLIAESVRLIVLTGGTGVSPRDVTPEATRAVIERDGRPLVFVIKDGRAQWTYILPGRSNGTYTEVLTVSAPAISQPEPGVPVQQVLRSAELLVGVPSFNNAATVGKVVAAAAEESTGAAGVRRLGDAQERPRNRPRLDVADRGDQDRGGKPGAGEEASFRPCTSCWCTRTGAAN